MKYYIILLLIISLGLYSCTNNDDYLTDGGIANENVKMTTFDFLKSHKELDTLALLIQRADMINVVNTSSTTLFATNNLSVKKYVNEILTQKRLIDPNATFSLDDIDVQELKKILGNYIFDQTIDRSKLVKEGKIYITHSGEERLLSLEPTDEYSGQLDQHPEYVYYTYKVGSDWDPTDQIVDDIKSVIRTSNIKTTNGIVHVLQGNHIFSNYRKP